MSRREAERRETGRFDSPISYNGLSRRFIGYNCFFTKEITFRNVYEDPLNLAGVQTRSYRSSGALTAMSFEKLTR